MPDHKVIPFLEGTTTTTTIITTTTMINNNDNNNNKTDRRIFKSMPDHKVIPFLEGQQAQMVPKILRCGLISDEFNH